MSDLKPGKYRMTVEVEVDEEGYLLPHDSGEMFMADWWVQNDATFEPVPPPPVQRVRLVAHDQPRVMPVVRHADRSGCVG